MYTLILTAIISSRSATSYFAKQLQTIDWQKGSLRITKQMVISYLIAFLAFSSIAGLFLFNSWTTTETQAAWFNDNWGYRKEIPITAHTSEELNEYIEVTLADTDDLVTAGKLQSDCGDMRFTKQNGEILPYYIASGCNSSSTVIHINFDTFPAGAQTIYIYYGNAVVSDGFSAADFSSEASNYTVGTIGSEEKGASPLAYWKFDEGQGTTANNSTGAGSALNGTISDADWKTEDQCISGKCLFFDGSSSSVSVTQSGAINGLGSGDFTLSTWVKINSGATQNIAFITKRTDEGDGVYFGSQSTSTVLISGADWSTGTHTFTVSIRDGRWHQLIAVRDGTTISLYVDGKEISATTGGTGASGDISNSQNIQIGSDNQLTDKMIGIMDEVKIYNNSRSAAQVQADYNARSNPEGVAAILGTKAKNMPGALSDGLVGYWKLDETSGNASDSSGNGYNLTNTNTATFTGGKFGNAGSFSSASSQYFTAASNSNFVIGNNSKTFTAWVNLSSKSADRHIFGKWSSGTSNNEYGLYYNSSADRFRFEVTPNGASGSIVAVDANDIGSPSTGVWYFIVGTYNYTTGTVSIQVNNGAVNSTSGASTVFSGTNNLTLGSLRSSSATNFWNGTIDEARIYNRVLSPDEVSQLYNWAPGPNIYLKMDEGSWTNDCSTSTVFDYSGNGKNATSCPNTTGSTTPLQGKYNKAGEFDGTDDYLDVASPELPTRDFSYSFWMNADDTSSSLTSLVMASDGSGGNEMAIYYQNSDLLVHLNGGSVVTTSSNPITPATWIHVAVIRSGSSVRIYVNNNLINSGTNSSTLGFSTCQLLIGTESDASCVGNLGNYYNGKIDDLRIYNYARTSSQIVEDMNAGHPGPGSPVGTSFTHWKFDEGFGTTVNNIGHGGTGLTGTLVNMASPATSTSGWTNSAKFNKGLNFDGSNDTISLASESSYDFGSSSTFTISGWIKTSDTSGENAIFSKMDDGDPFTGYELTIHDSFPRFYLISEYSEPDRIEVRSSTNVADGNWHYIAVTYDGSSNANGVKIYVDGRSITTSIESNTLTGSPLNNITPYIGSRNNENKYFNGSMDEIKIYTQTLTAAQINLDMNRGSSQVMGTLSIASDTQPNSSSNQYCPPDSSSTICAAPVGEWNFDEGTGTTANDTSGGGSSGSISGATYANGKINKALNFTGGTNAVTVSNSISTRTVEFWINPSTTSENLIDLRTSATAANISVSSGTIAATGFTSPTIYVNGVVSSTLMAGIWQHVTITTGSTITANAISFGRIGSTSLTGKLDTIRFYDYARSPSQVAWSYNKGAPIAHWKLDECQGTTINDMSGNNLTGSLTVGGSGSNSAVGTCQTSGAWFNGVSGKRNYSLDFDGTDDYITFADNDLLDLSDTEDASIAFWFNRDAFPATEALIGKINSSGTTGYTIGFTGSDNFSFLIIDGSDFYVISTTQSFTSSGWNHAVIVWDQDSAANSKIYINGIEAAVSRIGTIGNVGSAANSDALTVGQVDSDDYFNGKLDDIRIYNYPLTLTQVKAIHNDGAIRYGPVTGSP